MIRVEGNGLPQVSFLKKDRGLLVLASRVQAIQFMILNLGITGLGGVFSGFLSSR